VPQVTLYVRRSGTRAYERFTNRYQATGKDVFVIRYRENGKRIWETLKATNPVDAQLEVVRRSYNVTEKPAPKPVAPKPAPRNPDFVNGAIDKYIDNVRTLRSDKTARGYDYTLGEFYKAVGNKPMAEIAKQDLLTFIAHMREQGLGDRTIHNRIVEVVTFLRANGIKEVTVRVKYVEKKVVAYTPDELKAMFAAATEEEKVLFQFFLFSGAREQEVMYACWSDLKGSIYTVHCHPEYGFKPKDFEEREIRLPDAFVAVLRSRKNGSPLMFPTKKGQPNGHFLRVLKGLAERAGLDPAEAGLHKFRKTYATLQHENGVTARTIQARLGHSDLATTLAYLQAGDIRGEKEGKAVNNTFAAFA
jgi:integrase/recombinase XerD